LKWKIQVDKTFKEAEILGWGGKGKLGCRVGYTALKISVSMASRLAGSKA
jgi:hypothetical protein